MASIRTQQSHMFGNRKVRSRTKKEMNQAQPFHVDPLGEVMFVKPTTNSSVSATDTESYSVSDVSDSTGGSDEQQRLHSITTGQHTVLELTDTSSATTTQTTTTKSILKPSYSQPMINDSKRAWKVLPKPDTKAIITRSPSLPEIRLAIKQQRKEEFNVRFGTVQIRSYVQTIGDNPSVSYGPPISLDWEYEEHQDVQLDDYELARGPKRTLRQMVLSYYHRKNVLAWQYGFSEEELKLAKKQANRAKLRREITRSLLPVMRAEAAVESMARKAKRILT